MKKIFCIILLFSLCVQTASAGILFVRSSGITLTRADGITLTGADGITLTGADGFLPYRSNGITLTGADGITLTGADGVRSAGSNGATYTGPNGITLTGADGITLTGADGITLTGADGITLTGADGRQYTADSVIVNRPSGITLTGADGITLTGADGITLTGADGAALSSVNGITLTGADGITLTGADGITLTGADGSTVNGAENVTGVGPDGVVFSFANPAGMSFSGADGITLTGADGVSVTSPVGIAATAGEIVNLLFPNNQTGIQSIDPEIAIALNNASDDSSINAVIVYHRAVSEIDLAQLREIGITGGTRFRKLPFIYVSATRSQLIAVSRLASVRSIYGNRTLQFNADPYLAETGVGRVASDADLTRENAAGRVTGRNVTVAVLDTGINALHGDLAGKVVQNVRLTDTQSVPVGFIYPAPLENVQNTDTVSGHGTFVAGQIAASGINSGGRLTGVAPGARLLGLAAGDATLLNVLSGFDYLLDKGAAYGVRVVNCSFSANTPFDLNDPVNVATKMLTENRVNVVFSAGNSGAGNGTLNPYSVAPWVIGVGATDRTGKLAPFSSRGVFGDDVQHPTLVAPGVNVASLRSFTGSTGAAGMGAADTERLSASELPYYTTASGTSFSAPQVAGAVALMLEVNPALTPAAIKDILSRTATPLPANFYHEAGAGMLNTHAAVLEAAFPERRMGVFRSVLARNAVRFETRTTQLFGSSVLPGNGVSYGISVPQDTVQTSITISWSLGANDFGLQLFDRYNQMAGESNSLNLPGITGLRETVVLRRPEAGSYSALVRNSLPVGTTQEIFGSVESTRIVFPVILDSQSMTESSLMIARESVMSGLMAPEGKKFRPGSAVSRVELAEALVRSGKVPQYTAGAPMFTDVGDAASRSCVESVQSNPGGKLIYDAAASEAFFPRANASRIVAAVAFVRAARMDDLAASAILPANVTDAGSIPPRWRGYVALALQKGFLSLNGNYFNSARSLTRIELAAALLKLKNL